MNNSAPIEYPRKINFGLRYHEGFLKGQSCLSVDEYFFESPPRVLDVEFMVQALV